MTTRKAPSFKTIPAGTAVSWHYRSAIGHGIKGGSELIVMILQPGLQNREANAAAYYEVL